MCRTEDALRRRRCWLAAAACACTAAAAAFAGASGHGRAVGILDGRGAGFRTVLVNAAHAAGIMREKRPADREGADGRLKHIVIDKVYFPKDREDAGIAAVHGWINGNFVQGDLQLQRTAKYNAADGSWLGVPNRPPRLSTYKSAVEGVVAHSIRAAMQSLSTHKQQVPPTSLVKLNSLGRDPETALTIDIAKAAHQAVEEVLNAESAHETVAKLKARRARVFQLKRVRRRLPSRQLRARWRRPGPKSKTLRGCTCLAPCALAAAAASAHGASPPAPAGSKPGVLAAARAQLGSFGTIVSRSLFGRSRDVSATFLSNSRDRACTRASTVRAPFCGAQRRHPILASLAAFGARQKATAALVSSRQPRGCEASSGTTAIFLQRMPTPRSRWRLQRACRRSRRQLEAAWHGRYRGSRGKEGPAVRRLATRGRTQNPCTFRASAEAAVFVHTLAAIRRTARDAPVAIANARLVC